MLFDDLGSPLSTSSVTLFSVRPPELQFVMQQNQYFRWFDRNQVDGNIETKLKYCETSMSHCFEKSAWIDGQTGHIRVRKLALPNILDYISACPPDDFEGIIYKTRLKFFFNQLWSDSNCLHPDDEQRYRLKTFVCEMKERYLPVVWNESVRPTRTNHFFVHILLSMGSFVDEYSLFSQPNIRESYICAQLLDPLAPHHSAKLLTRRYFEEQLS